MNSVLFSSKTDQWPTPQFLFDVLDSEFGFTLDPCADVSNAKCPNFFTSDQNGLLQSWADEVVFCNPPYGRKLIDWFIKSYNEVFLGSCRCVVLLVPSRTDQAWFHDYALKYGELRFIRGRLHFGDSPNPAPFPSVLVIFRKSEV